MWSTIRLHTASLRAVKPFFYTSVSEVSLVIYKHLVDPNLKSWLVCEGLIHREFIAPSVRPCGKGTKFFIILPSCFLNFHKIIILGLFFWGDRAQFLWIIVTKLSWNFVRIRSFKRVDQTLVNELDFLVFNPLFMIKFSKSIEDGKKKPNKWGNQKFC